ncbi:MAG: VWA domain-containing protein [Vicinamibacterales bacterium]
MIKILLLGAVLVAQALPAQQPTFRARVDQVLVDVVVTDRNDRPITDLSAADFEIVENGRVQKITDFQFVSVPVSTTPLEASTREARAAAPLPDVATNRPPASNSRLFVLIIDDLHIIESEIIPVKRIITDFLTALAPDDEVGVVFTGRSDLGINITRDRARLLAALDRVRDAMGFGLDALHRLPGAGDPVIDEKRKLKYNVPAQYLGAAMLTLMNVADALADSPHPRRAIVFVSAGSALDMRPSLNSPEYQEAMALRNRMTSAYEYARRANVPIYTLDPRGGHTMPEDAVRGGLGTIGGLTDEVPLGGRAAVAKARPHELTRAQIAHNIRIQQHNLSEIAINTGGRAFINQSNLSRAVNEIVAENGSYYLLGYSPEPLTRDGKFHEIDIRVKREGVRVRGRDGYVAPAAAPGSTDPVEELNTAMTSAINVTGIGLRGVATPLGPGPKGTLTAVTLQVTYPMLPGSTAPIDDVLRVHLTGLDPDAKVKATAEHAFAFKAQPMDADHVTFLINGLIDLPPQPLTLRLGLSSRALGRVGMVQLPIHPPRISDSALHMSGIAIALEGRAEPALGGDLIRSLVPFQPTTARAFTAADTLRIFARTFWGSKDDSVQVTFGVSGPKDIAPLPISLAAAAEGNRRQATFETTLPLGGLPPGDYVLHVEARLPNKQTARRDVPFQITR